MNQSFRFKRFEICQAGSAMKVGTDGVLLGAWCSVGKGVDRVLDVGVGTGLIALMLAQRSEGSGATVDGVEIDAGSCEQALENVANSPWAERINVENISIQEFTERHLAMGVGSKYDLIVSNPPYFTSSLLPPDTARATARHATQLTYGELLDAAVELLTGEGLFALVLPYDQAERVVAMASERGLWLHRRTDIIPSSGALPKRSLMEFSPVRGSEACVASLLTVELSRHQYTTEYMELTTEFYLKF